MRDTPEKTREQGDPGHFRRVTVYAASSRQLDQSYLDAARRLGAVLAQAGLSIVYGGGGTGLMGALADGALSHGGEVHGVVPGFLMGLELSHNGLTKREVVDDMRTRKHRMLSGSDAVITLPGGCGTYEELLEAMTLKRLGQWTGPIVLVNTRGFYDRFIGFLEHSIEQGFMSRRHADMWSVVSEPEEAIGALHQAAPWTGEALRFANV